MNIDTGNEKIEEKIRHRIREYSMLPAGASVLVGFSGGADSMALLHFLWTHREEYTVSVMAVHINHLLRGEESERDQKLVETFCAERGIPLRIFRENIEEISKERKLSCEECGREIRYARFRETALGLKKPFRIATAHTASDLTETVLLNLTRGAGPKGLQGIPPVRGEIIRPLLSITREEVEEYCRRYDLSYCIDSTNLQPAYDRNRLRLSVIPVLKELNPALEEQVAASVELLRQDSLYLDALAQEAYTDLRCEEGYSCDALRNLSKPVLSRLLKRLLEEAGGKRLSFQNVNECMEALETRGVAMVSGGVRADATGSYLKVEVWSKAQQKAFPEEWCVPLHGATANLPDGRVFCILPVKAEEKIPCKENKINNLLFNNPALYDRILYTGIVRNRRSGDRYHPAGRSGSRSLKKLFNDAKVPPLERWNKAILVDQENGKILWAEGFGPSEEFAFCGACDKEQAVFKIKITEK